VLRTATRAEAYRDGLTHRCSMVLVRDAEGRIFTHRRSAQKQYAPSAHDVFVGGVLASGESYAEAAVREAEEELGVSGITVEPLFRFLFEDTFCSWFCDVGTAVWTGPVSPQAEEIDWYAWLTEEEVAELLATAEFVPDGAQAYQRYLAFRSA
jgi:8-oxo-dGTP pyrophosphatase MutT (NUDIX family)